jgi:hypothetical protein
MNQPPKGHRSVFRAPGRLSAASSDLKIVLTTYPKIVRVPFESRCAQHKLSNFDFRVSKLTRSSTPQRGECWNGAVPSRGYPCSNMCPRTKGSGQDVPSRGPLRRWNRPRTSQRSRGRRRCAIPCPLPALPGTAAVQLHSSRPTSEGSRYSPCKCRSKATKSLRLFSSRSLSDR